MNENELRLRDVVKSDLGPFFEMQRDPRSVAMADVPPRDHDAYTEHWRKILADPHVVTKTIELDGEVVGNVVSWIADDKRYVGYWIDRAHWGKGIASATLPRFLAELDDPVLYATTAKGNRASMRVLEKAGFERSGEKDDLSLWVLRRSLGAE